MVNEKRLSLANLSKSWAIPVIVNLEYQTLRFNDLKHKLRTNSGILSKRLSELQGLGLIERAVYPEMPPRVEYNLSKKGLELYESLTPLLEWLKKQGVT